MFCLHCLTVCRSNVSLRLLYYEKRDEFSEEIQKSSRGHNLSEDDVDEHKSDML